MTDMPIVAVRGEVTREVEPELATFSVTVSARDKNRQTTLETLTRRVEATRALLDQYAEAIERRETGGVRIYPEVKRKGEAVIAYNASVDTMVKVTDFTVLGDLLLRLGDQDQVSVNGPWWSLRPDSPVHREARAAAIAEAITRGKEYAAALGARITHLLQLADAGLSQADAGFGGPQTMMMAKRGAYDSGPELVIEPQRQVITAQVEARFAISDPTAL